MKKQNNFGKGLIAVIMTMILLMMQGAAYADQARGRPSDELEGSNGTTRTDVVNEVELSSDRTIWKVPAKAKRIANAVAKKGPGTSGAGQIVKKNRHVVSGSLASSYEVMSDEGARLYGVCCEHSKEGGKPGDRVTYTVLGRDHMLTRMMYYARTTEWPADGSGAGWGGMFNSGYGCRIAALAASLIMGDGPENGSLFWSITDAGSIKDARDLVEKSRGVTVPEGFKSYIVNHSNAAQQSSVMMDGNGTLKLRKKASGSSRIIKECPNAYTLAGAEYTVYDSAGRTVGVLKTNPDGNTDELSVDPGTYTIKETKAPPGFTLDEAEHKVTAVSGLPVTITSEETPLFDSVYLLLEKTAKGDSKYNTDRDMSGAHYEIIYYDTLDDIRSMNADKRKALARRSWVLKTVKRDLDGGNRYGTLMRESCRISGDEFFKDDKGRIVLPVGWISIREIKAPKGYKVDRQTYYQKIAKDQSNPVQTYYNAPEQTDEPFNPEIRTTAVDTRTESHVGAATGADKVKIVDKVEYSGLSSGEHVISGKLMDRSTGKPVQENGKDITASAKFKVDEKAVDDQRGASGTVNVEYEMDAATVSGRTTVIFEYLYFGDKLITSHENIDDEGQTVYFPEIKTTANSESTGDNSGKPSEKETITDKVHYSNLLPGKAYVLKGRLMDKSTGESLKDKDGREITAEKTFTPDKSEGDVEISFTYDSSARSGKATVVFEDLYYGDIQIAIHADINDAGQTITYAPKTGDTTRLLLSGIVFLLALGGAAACFTRKLRG